MPNHVINEIIFAGVDETVQASIVANAYGGDGNVDFGILLPAPLNLWRGSVGSSHEAAFKRTALDWNREHWGTKWNAYQSLPVEGGEDWLVLAFQTAWRPPYPWLAALFNRFNRPFDHNWFDEGRERGVSGRFRTDGRWGPNWSEDPADDATHRRLHKLMFGVEAFPDDEE